MKIIEHINKKQRLKKNKILLICNTNLGVDNILLKLKFDFNFYDFARVGNIYEIIFFVITNFITLNLREDKNVEELSIYLNNISNKIDNIQSTFHNKKETNEDKLKVVNNDDVQLKLRNHHMYLKEKINNKIEKDDINDKKLLDHIPSYMKEEHIHKIKNFDQLLNVLKKNKEFVLKNKYKNKRVIAGTCRSIHLFEKMNTIKHNINYLIVDECTQINELTLLRFFMKYPIKKFIFIGDVKQLGFVLKSKNDLSRSMFSRLIENELFIKYYFVQNEKNKIVNVEDNIQNENTNINNNHIYCENIKSPNNLNDYTKNIDNIIDIVNNLNDQEYCTLKYLLYEKMFDLHIEKKRKIYTK